MATFEKILRGFLILVLAGGLAASLGMVGLFSYYSRDLPEIRNVESYQAQQISRVYAKDGTVIGEIGEERRSLLPSESIPELLLNAFVAAEDSTFYQHEGLDFIGIMRAVLRNFLSLRIRGGGSTITQQLAKNLFLSNEKTFHRKIKEAILAYRLEQQLSKREILALYVNTIPFGNRCFGVAEAARFYFGTNVKGLNVGQIAYLAGMIQAQNRLALNRHPERAKERQRYVLRRLFELNYISEAEYRRFDAAPLVYTPPQDVVPAPYVVETVRRFLQERLGEAILAKGGLNIVTTLDPSMQTAAGQALRRNLLAYDRRHGYRPLPILTTEERETLIGIVSSTAKKRGATDAPALAMSAETPPHPLKDGRTPLWHTLVRRIKPEGLYFALIEAVDPVSGDLHLTTGHRSGRIAAADAAWGLPPRTPASARPTALAKRFSPGQLVVVQTKIGNNPKDLPSFVLAQRPEAQSAIVAIDPATHALRAMHGGFDFYLSPFNRATDALRQPGSSFKPFVYLTALRSHRYTPATAVEDAPLSYPLAGGRTWSPQNFDGKYRGFLPLRRALAQSLNTVAVRLADDLGLKPIIATAREFGITTPIANNLTTALGSSEVRLIELVNAYASLAALGMSDAPYLVEIVRNPRGRVLYRHTPAPHQAATPAETALMVDLLQSVVQNGTARRARSLGRPLAGKTGTTNDQVDAWFVGIAPSLACGVWVGYDDRRPLGRGETGGRAALPAWIDFMDAALADQPVDPFPRPAGLVGTWIDPETGAALPGDDPRAVSELFLSGTEPRLDTPNPDLQERNP